MQSPLPYTPVATLLPSPKTTRGFSASLDISKERLLYFNSCSVIINQLTKAPIVFNHAATVTAASWNLDGRFVASGDEKGNLMVHQVFESQAVLTKQLDFCFGGPIKGIAWSPDHKNVVIVGEAKGQYGKIINLDYGLPQGEISGVSRALNTVAIRPEKPYTAVVGGEEYILKFFNGPPYVFAKQQAQHTSFVNQVRYSPTGQYLASVSSDKKLVVYDGKTGSVIKAKENAHQGGIMGVDWLGTDKLVTCSNDKTAKIWTVGLEELMVLRIKENGGIQDFQLAVRTSGDDVYTVTLNGNINHYKTPLATKSSQPTEVFEGFGGVPGKIYLDFKRDTFYTSDSSGKVFYYNASNKKLSTFKSPKEPKMIVSSDYSNDVLYTLLIEGILRTYDCNTFTFIEEKKLGDYNLIAADKSQPNFFAAAGDMILSSFKNGAKKDIKIDYQPTSLRFGPKSILAVGSNKGFVYLYNQDLTLQSKLKNSEYKITALEFDLQTLYVGDSSKAINIWDWKDQKKNTVNLGFHTGLVHDVVIGNKTVISGAIDNKVVLADKTGLHRLLELPHHHKRGVTSVAILGSDLVTVGGDMLCRIVKLNDLKEF